MACRARPQSVAAAADTSAELFDLSQHSAAPLTDRNYAKFAMSRSKPYHLFVLYTARESQYQCSICGCARALARLRRRRDSECAAAPRVRASAEPWSPSF